MSCNNDERILSYIKKLTKTNVISSNISTSLNDIMKYIDKYILHFEYDDINDAIKLIPKQARYLVDFIQLFSYYIDHCKSNSNYNIIKTFMCDNKCNLCKIYHLLASWGLLYIECLYINTSMSNRINQLLHMSMNHEKTIKNYILYHNETLLNLNNVFKCIKNSTKDKHLHFNKTLDKMKMELIQKIK